MQISGALALILCGLSSACASSFGFTVQSRRNLTGHWVVSVDAMKNAAVQEENGITMQVWHELTPSQLGENLQLKATAVLNNPTTTALHPTANNTGMSAVPCEARTSRTSVVPEGYELIQNMGYYKMYTWGEPWWIADQRCKQDGAHLIIINSKKEAELFRTIHRRERQNFRNVVDFPNGVHVGIHDLYEEGVYTTVQDTPLAETGYVVWDKNEPNNAGGSQDCVAASEYAKYWDYHCSTLRAFMCERELA